jgi:AcrR family transcriptional regulator
MHNRRPRAERRSDGRLQILAAARRLFTAVGYDGASVRDIAAEAGVDKMMINRWFGTKEALFTQVVADSFNISAYFTGDRAHFAERLIRNLFDERPDAEGFDAIAVTLRSLANERAVEILTEEMDRRIIEPLIRWIGGADARARALSVHAQLIGAAALVDIVKSRYLDTVDREALIARLARPIQELVEDTCGAESRS